MVTKQQISMVLDTLEAKAKLLSTANAKKVTQACGLAGKSSSSLVKELKTLAKSLGDTAEMAAAWEVGAAAILKQSKNKKPAGDCHGFARIIERKLGSEETDLDKRLVRDAVFAHYGGLWMKELVSTLKACAKLRTQAAKDMAVQMAVDTLTLAGEEPNGSLLSALAPFGEEIASRLISDFMLKDAGKSVFEAGESFWEDARSALVASLKKSDAMVRWAAGYMPRNGFAPWVQTLLESQMEQRVRQVDPSLALSCLEIVAASACDPRLRLMDADQASQHFANGYALLDRLAPLVKEQGLPVSCVQTGWYDLKDHPWAEARLTVLNRPNNDLLDFELLELFLAHGLDILYPVTVSSIALNQWCVRKSQSPSVALTRVSEHPVFGPLLESSLAGYVGSDCWEAIMSRAAATPGMAKALRFIDGQARPLPPAGDPAQDRAITIRNTTLANSAGRPLGLLVEQGTLGGLDHLLDKLAKLTAPAVVPLLPTVCRAIASLDPVRLLQGQLRAGLLDEFGFARKEALMARLAPKKADLCHVEYDYPYIIVLDGKRLVVEGPDGIVLDETSTRTKDLEVDENSLYYLDGNVVACDDERVLPLLGKGKAIPIPMGHVNQDLLHGGLLRIDGKRIRTLADIDATDYDFERHQVNCFWYDDKYVYLSSGNHCRDADDDFRLTHEIGSQKRLEQFVLPAFLASRVGENDKLLLKYCEYQQVEKGAEACPVGAREGLSAFACWWSHKDGCYRGESNAGHRASHHAPFDGVMRFPHREAVHCLLNDQIIMENGVALVPKDGTGSPRYWATPCGDGTFLHWVHWLVPRDLPGSKALAEASLDQVRAVFEAARKPRGPAAKGGQASRYEDMVLIVEGEDEQVDPLATWPEVAAAVQRAFPAITHPLLEAGVVRMAMTAVEVGQRLDQLKQRIASVMTQTGAAKPRTEHQHLMADEELVPLDPFFDASFDLPGHAHAQLGRQVLEVSDFLLANSTAATTEAFEPSACFVAWERCLVYGGEFLYHLLAPATPKETRERLVQFVTFFKDTALASNTERLRLLGLRFDHPPFPGISHDHRDFLAEWNGQRVFLRCDRYQNPWTFTCLHAHGDDLAVPAGAEVTWRTPFFNPISTARAEEALGLLRERGPIPFHQPKAKRFASETGILYGSAAMILAGCAYSAVKPDLRKQLEASADDIAHGKVQLGWDPEEPNTLGLEIHGILARALPASLDRLYQPDDQELVTALIAAWQAEHGKRSPVDIALVSRMEEDLRDPNPSFLSLAATLAAPDDQACLSQDIEWVHRPWSGGFAGNELHFRSVPSGWPIHVTMKDSTWSRWPPADVAFSYEALHSSVKLLAWANLELAGGDPLRAKAARVAELVTARLLAPHLLLPVGTGPITDRDAFWHFVGGLGGKPYQAAGGEGAQGMVAGGLVLVWPDREEDRDGVFVSLAPSQLAAPSARQALWKALGIDDREQIHIPGATIKAYPYWSHYRLWQSEGFASIRQELASPLADGAYPANPSVSAPVKLASIAEALGLSTEAAMLFMQVSVLGEPTAKRLLRYNAWKKTTLDKASKELVAKKLVEERKHKSTKQTLFLPGEVSFHEPYPAPVEKAKLKLLGLAEGERPPLGIPLNVTALGFAFESLRVRPR
jgi:hypothetical protein